MSTPWDKFCDQTFPTRALPVAPGTGAFPMLAHEVRKASGGGFVGPMGDDGSLPSYVGRDTGIRDPATAVIAAVTRAIINVDAAFAGLRSIRTDRGYANLELTWADQDLKQARRSLGQAQEKLTQRVREVGT